MDVAELSRWVREGEGKHLEFKRKANHPDKIARELVAFANTEGGRLLVGVDDDGTIYGVKEAEADADLILQYLHKYVTPAISIRWELVSIRRSRDVLVLRISTGDHLPHYLLVQEEEVVRKIAYVRVRDMSVRATREMVSVLHHRRHKRGVSLHVGEAERLLLQHLENVPNITLDDARNLLKTSRRKVATKLILLVRAGLLRIHPTERGDRYSLSEEAFRS